jgi:hypothetical protein
LIIKPPKRKSYSIKSKLDIIRSYEKGSSGKGLPSIISRDTLRGWIAKKDQLEAALKDQNIESRKVRRLAGGGRNLQFEILELELIALIKEKIYSISSSAD